LLLDCQYAVPLYGASVITARTAVFHLSQLLTDLAAKFKTRPFSYFWAEGAQQPALEATVGVGG
jgi:hypothetical protein